MSTTLHNSDSFKNIGNILVVGDWFVDEYWFVVRHHSEISSHSRPFHYRIFSETNHDVRDLCGGGLITRILYELRKYKIEILNTIKNEISNIKNNKESWHQSFLDEHKEQIKQIEEGGPFRLQTIRQLNEILADLKQRTASSIEIITDPEDEIYQVADKQYQLFGLGRWHFNDQNILQHFIHARCQKEGERIIAQACSSVNINILCKHKIDAELYNLEPKDSLHGTTRCIRAYRFVSGRFKQLHRIDCEQAASSIEQTHEESVIDGLNIDKDKLTVIIDDHKKGVITENLIVKLKNKASTAKWFVRTKDNHIRQDSEEWPDWLKQIDSIELLVVGPEISCRAYPVNGLLTEKDRLTEHAYELIDRLIKGQIDYDQRKIKNAVLTSDKFEVVVLLDKFCFIAKPLDKNIENIELGKINWTTAFFAAFVYEMLEPKNEGWKGNEVICKEMIKQAIKNAHEHSGVKIPEVLRAPTDKSCREASLDSAPRTEPKKVCDWECMQERWKKAKSDLGIIEVKEKIQEEKSDGKKLITIEKEITKERYLDIWRPSTDLPGFIVCVKEKREAIRRIWQKINSFILREDPTQPLSILLEADPAVGKSFLVKTLAEVSNCERVEHDITQMIERTELLDLFDRVADAQARSSKPVLVFVDEINATLGGSPVYGAFLSPLESGRYVRNGQYIELKPCIWMFAGTPDSDSRASDNDKAKKEKREDFESRMTMIERIDYKSMFENRIVGRAGINFKHEAKLEQVYLGAKRINDAFNDVKQIDRDVLKAFYELEPEEAPARRIKRLAASLENVQYGRVHKGNCTSLEWQKVIDENILLEHRPKWRDKFAPLEVEYVDINLS
jgi:hypothetical protein